MSNALVDLMREYGVEVRMLGTEEEPSRDGVAIGDMLVEIHQLRERITAYEATRPVVSDELLTIDFAVAYFNMANRNGLHHLNELDKVSLSDGIRAVRARLEGRGDE